MSGKRKIANRPIFSASVALIGVLFFLAGCTSSTPEKVVEFSVNGVAMERPLGEPFLREGEAMAFSLAGPDSYSFDVEIKNPNDVPIAVEVGHSAFNTETYVDDVLTTQSGPSKYGEGLHQSYERVIYKLEPGEERTVDVRVEAHPQTLAFMVSFVADDSELWVQGVPISDK